MFHTGDTIFYGGSGVCRIDGMTTREFDGEMRDYYVLVPVHGQASTVYLPADNEKLLGRMRQVISRDEVYRLIHALPESKDLWIENEGLRRTEFQRILREGHQGEISALVRTVYLHQRQLQSRGRKLRQNDERMFKEAQRMFCDEVAYVLDMPVQQVAPFIGQELGGI
jgi:CarD family transcriptional regulator